jgi:predicted dienelactone hydrolase
MSCHGICMVAAVVMFLAGRADAADSAYDPLALPPDARPEILDLTVPGEERGDDIPVRVYLPSERKPEPVVLFSHGLGGSREGSAYLGRHWAGRGYVAVFVQHPGSDVSVWQDKPLLERMSAMKQAASLQNLRLRVEHIHKVLDRLERWNAAKASPLFGRLDLERIGMSGHSFGAMTTQAVSGQQFPLVDGRWTDSRIKAAIAFSPSSPRRGDPKRAFGQVKIPWMLMTGTKDIALLGYVDMKSRLAVFPALPPGGKYEVVFFKAEHSAFTERALPGDTEKRNPNHHRAILALSTAFWDAWLRNDAAARAWLDGDGPRSILEKEDRWLVK